MELFIVYLQEGALDDELSFVLPFLHFLEDQFDHSWNDPQIFILQPYCVPTTHSVSLATASLTIGKYCCIVALETT